MQGEVFTYLEKKLSSEFENCGWTDDLSDRFENKELADMRGSIHDMVVTERKVKEFIDEIHSKLKYYK